VVVAELRGVDTPDGERCWKKLTHIIMAAFNAGDIIDDISWN
jgi:hypothetical protein